MITRSRVWLDMDPGIGIPLRDANDELANLFLLGSAASEGLAGLDERTLESPVAAGRSGLRREGQSW
jgi:hypothetical protein